MIKLLDYDSDNRFSIFICDSFAEDFYKVGQKVNDYGLAGSEVQNYKFRFGDMLMDFESSETKQLKSKGWVDI